MTANIDKQQMFIELRAEGKSFDEIVKKVNISKPTLIKWSKEFEEKINEVSKIIEDQFIIEQKVKRTLRAQKISEELDKAYEALKHADYKNMSKKDLISVIEKLENKLNMIIGTEKSDGKPEEYKIIVEQRTIGANGEVIKETPRIINRVGKI